MKLSEDLRETWAGMIADGTGGYDILDILDEAAEEAEKLESRIAELEAELLARPTDEQFERIRNAEYEASHRITELEKKLAACEESRQNIGTERDNLDLALLEFQNENAELRAQLSACEKEIESYKDLEFAKTALKEGKQSNCCELGTCPKCVETMRTFTMPKKPTYEQLESENTRLRMAINSIVRGTVKIEFIKATKPFYTITDNNICHCERNWEGAIDFLMTRVNALEA